MTLLILGIFLRVLVSFFVFLSAWFLSKRSLIDREKSSPFECGFDPKFRARIPFSIRFFLLAVIFLIFDVEIALLLPFPFVATFNYRIISIFAVAVFLFILILGLLHEWKEGSLDWVENK